jgi:hypothetical protein
MSSVTERWSCVKYILISTGETRKRRPEDQSGGGTVCYVCMSVSEPDLQRYPGRHTWIVLTAFCHCRVESALIHLISTWYDFGMACS